MPRVVWDPRLPPETRAAFEVHFLPGMRFLPSWVTDVRIEFDEDDTTSRLYVAAKYEYRRGTIFVCAPFLQANGEMRRRSVLHEIVHFGLDPVDTVILALIEVLGDKPELQAWAREQRRVALESSTCDLTESLLAALAMDCDSTACPLA